MIRRYNTGKLTLRKTERGKGGERERERESGDYVTGGQYRIKQQSECFWMAQKSGITKPAREKSLESSYVKNNRC